MRHDDFDDFDDIEDPSTLELVTLGVCILIVLGFTGIGLVTVINYIAGGLS